MTLNWTQQGDVMPRDDIDDLLDQVRSTFQQKVASGESRWEDTVTHLDGHAIFYIQHEPNARHSFTWLNAKTAVQAMIAKMSKDGYYERSATISMGDEVLVAEMGIVKDLAQRRVSNVTVSQLADENDIHLHCTHRGRRMYWQEIITVLNGAIENASDKITHGKGNDIVLWNELKWRGNGVSLSIWPNLSATPHMTWEMTLDVLRLFLEKIRSIGWREVDADIVWKGARGDEQVIGEIQLFADRRQNITSA